MPCVRREIYISSYISYLFGLTIEAQFIQPLAIFAKRNRGARELSESFITPQFRAENPHRTHILPHNTQCWLRFELRMVQIFHLGEILVFQNPHIFTYLPHGIRPTDPEGFNYGAFFPRAQDRVST